MSLQTVSENDAPRITRAVTVLIAINIAIRFLQWTVFRDSAGQNSLETVLGFSWAAFAEHHHWWTAISYMFVHDGVLYLAANMYALFVFGPRLEHSWGTKRFVWFYLFCGICAVLGCIAFARSPDSAALVGSSGAIFGVMTAYAIQWPNDDIFLLGAVPMRVWTMVILLIGVTLAMGLNSSTAGLAASMVYFSHLGGALGGWFYVRTPQPPSLEELRQRVSRVPDAEDPPRAIPRSHPRTRDRGDDVDEIVARSKALAAKRSMVAAPPPSSVAEAKNEDIDRVLDKISEHGLASLTSEERRMLEAMSKRLREN